MNEILSLTTPRERQVFQRAARGRASVTIAGTAPAGADAVDACAELASEATRGRGIGWKTVAKGLAGGAFQGALTLPEGGWYRIRVRARAGKRILAEGAVERVGVGDVFVTAGQSNSANYGQVRQAASDPRVVYFDGADYLPARDPIPGGFGDGGSVWAPLGDLLAKDGGVPVCFRSATLTYTPVSEWLPGSVQYRTLRERAEVFGKGGVRAVLWHQGESDSLVKTSAAQYAERLGKTIAALRQDLGYPVDWYVAQASFHPGSTLPDQTPIADGQRLLWKSGVARPGPVTDDLLGPDWRYDGVHFSVKGLQEHARRWRDALRRPR